MCPKPVAFWATETTWGSLLTNKGGEFAKPRRPTAATAGVLFLLLLLLLLDAAADTNQVPLITPSSPSTPPPSVVIVLLTEQSSRTKQQVRSFNARLKAQLLSSANDAVAAVRVVPLHALEKRLLGHLYLKHHTALWTLWPTFVHLHKDPRFLHTEWFVFVPPDACISWSDLRSLLLNKTQQLQQGASPSPSAVKFGGTEHDFFGRGVLDLPGALSIVHDFRAAETVHPWVNINTGFVLSSRLLRHVGQHVERDPDLVQPSNYLCRDVGYELARLMREVFGVHFHASNNQFCGPPLDVDFPRSPYAQQFVDMERRSGRSFPYQELADMYDEGRSSKTVSVTAAASKRRWDPFALQLDVHRQCDANFFNPFFAAVTAFSLAHRHGQCGLTGLDVFKASMDTYRRVSEGAYLTCSSATKAGCAVMGCSLDGATTDSQVYSVEPHNLHIAIKTHQGNHKSRVELLLKRTWLAEAARISTVYSDVVDESLPSRLSGVPNSERGHGDKLHAILRDMWRRFGHGRGRRSRVSWFFIADDDTVLCLPCLRKVLRRYDPSVPQYIGQRYGHNSRYVPYSSMTSQWWPHHGYDYLTLGAGAVLSHAALRAFELANMDIDARGDSADNTQCGSPGPTYPDDMWMGQCIASLGIPIVHEDGFRQAWADDYDPQTLSSVDIVSMHSGPAAQGSHLEAIAVYRTMLQKHAFRELQY